MASPSPASPAKDQQPPPTPAHQHHPGGSDSESEGEYEYGWDFYYEQQVEENASLLNADAAQASKASLTNTASTSARSEQQRFSFSLSNSLQLLGGQFSQSKPGTTVRVSVRRKIWTFLETDPYLNAFLLAVIAVSTIAFCLETVQKFKKYQAEFLFLESFVVVVFSAEIITRYIAAPMSTSKFFSMPMNWVDLISILPFFLEQGCKLYEHFFYTDVQEPNHNLTVVRCLRLARLFKFGRYSSEMSLVTGAFLRSSVSFMMLGFMLSIALVVFSTLLYLVEQGDWDSELGCHTRAKLGIEGDFLKTECSPFASIPKAFWWAITTMTTVGYGDTFPVTPVGKLIGGCAMVCGILSVALPTTVLGVQFGDSYAEIQEEREREKISLLLPSDDHRQEELGRQIAQFQELRKSISEIRTKVEPLAAKLVEKEEQASFITTLQFFDSAVENSTANLEQHLMNLRNRQLLNSRSGSLSRLGTGATVPGGTRGV
ncbi:unnamed protein product [Amoebophrya sp. A120]|nr:unnamed protein product [Amoebophrya sp. A120]|eukprot:GSA120T00000501001.1